MSQPDSPAASPSHMSPTPETVPKEETPAFEATGFTAESPKPEAQDVNDPEEEENPEQPSYPVSPHPADFVPPTSADLAFIASLPRPEIAPDPQEKVPGEPATSSTKEETIDDLPPLDPSATASSAEGSALPEGAVNDMFGAISRQWYAANVNTALERRDTWAVSNRWIRHVRVIEGGNKEAAKQSRK